MNGSGTRALLRIARRNIGRSRWRSVLIAVLIGLPVAAMVGATAVMIAVTPTAGESATHQMGRADAIVYPSSEGASAAKLHDVLSPGSRVEPFLYTEDHLVLTGMQASVTLRSLDLDGLARGMVRVTAGRAPRSGDEVAISQSVARLAGVDIGDQVTLSGLGRPTVVGLVEDRFDLISRFLLVDPGIAAAAPDGQATWLVALPPRRRYRPGSRVHEWSAVLRHHPGRPGLAGRPGQPHHRRARRAGHGRGGAGGRGRVRGQRPASAARAGTAGRHRRGATTPCRHVIAEAMLLGMFGSAGGVIVGLVGAAAISPWLDQLTNRRTPPMGLSPAWIAVSMGIGLLASLLAALVPAWTASRVPVMTALSGRRPPSSPAHRTLAVGVAHRHRHRPDPGWLCPSPGGCPEPVEHPDAAARRGGWNAGLRRLQPVAGGTAGAAARHLPLASRIALRDTARRAPGTARSSRPSWPASPRRSRCPPTAPASKPATLPPGSPTCVGPATCRATWARPDPRSPSSWAPSPPLRSPAFPRRRASG